MTSKFPKNSQKQRKFSKTEKNTMFSKIIIKLKSFWKFLWYDDSMLSWMINILFAFISIKFIIYPLLGLILGTNLPIVAVISGSMDHEGDFDSWYNSTAYCGLRVCTQKDFYEEYDITRESFDEFPLKNGFRRGDVILLRGVDKYKLVEGDVIVFNSETENSYPIIHRIIDVNANSTEINFVTKGDHNSKPMFVEGHLNEYNISSENILGKGFFRIPYVGYVKLIFVDSINFLKNLII